MIEKLNRSAGKVLGFKMSGKMHDADYQRFTPEFEAALAGRDRVRLLAHFEDFHGWDLHALWDDIKWGATYGNRIERIAMVGDKKWEEWMSKLCKPFTKAEVKYFDAGEIESAWQWVEGD